MAEQAPEQTPTPEQQHQAILRHVRRILAADRGLEARYVARCSVWAGKCRFVPIQNAGPERLYRD